MKKEDKTKLNQQSDDFSYKEAYKMSNQQKIDFIRQKCIEANPDIRIHWNLKENLEGQSKETLENQDKPTIDFIYNLLNN